MKIWCQSMASLEALPAYRSSLHAHVRRCLGEDADFEFHGVDDRIYAGSPPADVVRYPYLRYLVHRQIFDQCTRAEAGKFDVIAFASFAEPFLSECRSLVSVPIASMAECTLLVGCSLAEKMALITLAPANVTRVRALVQKHRLGERVSGIYPLSPSVTERDLNAAFTSPQAVLDNFESVAARAVEEGADLVIPAEGVLNELISSFGPRRISNVSVMDSLAVVLRYAEMLTSLKMRTGLEVGRKWSHSTPTPELLAKIQQAADQIAATHK